MKLRGKPLVWDLLWFCGLYLWVAIYSYPYLFHALTGNLREIRSYNLDAGDALIAVEDALHAPWLFFITFNNYGHFYTNLSLILASLYGIIHPPTEGDLFFIIQLNALLGGCSAIAMSYIFAKRYLGRLEAIFASAIVASSPAFLFYSTNAKPDSWQIFFILLSLYFLARAWEKAFRDTSSLPLIPRADFRFVVASSAAAGAAFGTKYLGLFLLPLVALGLAGISLRQVNDVFFARVKRGFAAVAWLLGLGLLRLAYKAFPLHVLIYLRLISNPDAVGMFSPLIEAGRVVCVAAALGCFAATAGRVFSWRTERFDTIFKGIFVAISVFGAFWVAFFLTSPWMLYGFPFIRVLFLRDAFLAANDFLGTSDKAGLSWLNILFASGEYVRPLTGGLALAGMACSAYALAMRRTRGADLAFLAILGFSIIFLCLLIIKITLPIVLYGLPFVPLIALFAAYFLSKVVPLASARLGLKAGVVGPVLAVLLLAPQILQGFSVLRTHPNLVTTLTPENQQMGQWFLKCIPVTTGILTGSYSYVPPQFVNAEMGDGYFYFARANNPPIVSVNLDIKNQVEAVARTSPARADRDRMKLYAMVADPQTWRPGPAFGKYQLYLRPDVRLTAGCAQ